MIFPVSCPICSAPLLRSGPSYSCRNRHNFDRSREGYLSLLHGRRNYQDLGDDRSMVQARLRAHRLPVFQELAEAMASRCPPTSLGHGALDVGCGDGFFLDRISRAGGSPGPGVGIDVSKEALASAARNYPGLFFVRADVAHDRLPFADRSFGLVLSVFAPRPVDEIRRVLREDGFWLIVTATPEHLREIREFIPLAAIGADKMAVPAGESFSILSSGAFASESTIGWQDLVAIVEMSPSIHRLKREFGAAWTERIPRELAVTFSFGIALLGRPAG